MSNAYYDSREVVRPPEKEPERDYDHDVVVGSLVVGFVIFMTLLGLFVK